LLRINEMKGDERETGRNLTPGEEPKWDNRGGGGGTMSR